MAEKNPCIFLYNKHQNIGLQDVESVFKLKPEKLNEKIEEDNDGATIEMLKNMQSPFETYTQSFMSEKEKLGEDNARINLAKKCGCFFVDNNFISSNQYITSGEPAGAIPYIPGDEIYSKGAFGQEQASHHGTYLGTDDINKTGMTIEVDSLLGDLEGIMFVKALIQMLAVGGFMGIIRVYRDLSRDPGSDSGSPGGFFGHWETSGKDIRNLEPVKVYMNKTTSRPIEIITKSIKALQCKTYEYNLFTSSCEHFAKYLSSERFETEQVGNILGEVVDSIRSHDIGSDAKRYLEIVKGINITPDMIEKMNANVLLYNVISIFKNNENVKSKVEYREKRDLILLFASKILPNVLPNMTEEYLEIVFTDKDAALKIINEFIEQKKTNADNVKYMTDTLTKLSAILAVIENFCNSKEILCGEVEDFFIQKRSKAATKIQKAWRNRLNVDAKGGSKTRRRGKYNKRKTNKRKTNKRKTNKRKTNKRKSNKRKTNKRNQ